MRRRSTLTAAGAAGARRICAAIVLAVAALPTPAGAGAGPTGAAQTVEAAGTASIADGDEARARDEALLDAYRRALEAAGVRVHSHTEVSNFQVLIDSVTAGATGYLTSLDVASEGADGPLYRVRIRATVVPAGGQGADARDALAPLLRIMDDPTVAVAVGGPAPYAGEAETAVVRQFIDAGYHVVAALGPALAGAVTGLASGTSRRRAVLASVRAGADIVIAAILDAAPLGQVRIDSETAESAESVLHLRAVVGATGQTLFAGMIKAPALHLTPEAAMRQASRLAGERAGGRLIWDVAREYATLIRGRRSLRVVVFAPTVGRVEALVGRMRAIRGVDGRAYLRRYDTGVGVIDVTSAFPMRILAPRLEALGMRAVLADVNQIILEAR